MAERLLQVVIRFFLYREALGFGSWHRLVFSVIKIFLIKRIVQKLVDLTLVVKSVLILLMVLIDSYCEVYGCIDKLLQSGQTKSFTSEYSHLTNLKLLLANDLLYLHDLVIHVQILQEVIVLR